MFPSHGGAWGTPSSCALAAKGTRQPSYRAASSDAGTLPISIGRQTTVDEGLRRLGLALDEPPACDGDMCRAHERRGEQGAHG